MSTSPGGAHPARIEIHHIATQAECESAVHQVVAALVDSLDGKITITSASCRRE
jgi:hypothetical protein